MNKAPRCKCQTTLSTTWREYLPANLYMCGVKSMISIWIFPLETWSWINSNFPKWAKSCYVYLHQPDRLLTLAPFRWLGLHAKGLGPACRQWWTGQRSACAGLWRCTTGGKDRFVASRRVRCLRTGNLMKLAHWESIYPWKMVIFQFATRMFTRGYI